MKKTMLVILLICLSTIILNPQDIYTSFNNSLKVCIFNLFPALFPFLIISHLMTNYGFIEVCNKYGKKLMNKLFKVNASGSYVLFLSMLSGSPSNAKYIKQLLDKNLINHQDANNLLKFTHFVNPLFIIGGIGIKLLKSKTLGIMILLCHYIGGITTGIMLHNNYKPINYNICHQNNNSFIDNLSHSIKDTINTLTLIFGIITSCFILSAIISNMIHIPNFLFGIIEITSGINYIITEQIPIFYKTIIITFLISFGGFSIHIQVLSVLVKEKIRYLPYLYSRIFHALIACLILTILFLINHHIDITF